jgi:hypothetical protein
MNSNNRVLIARLGALFLIVSLLACSPFGGTATPAPPESPIDTPAAVPATPALTPTESSSGPCQAVANTEVTIYERPSATADVFSTMPAGFTTPVEARTASGWLGFEPGVAQAANIGPFRLRWLEPAAVSLTGQCDDLPEVWAPPPGICFEMPMEDTEVHAEPDLASSLLIVLHEGEFAAVAGLSGTGWAKVDLGPGNTGSSVQGWIEETALNMNGSCDSLPMLVPAPGQTAVPAASYTDPFAYCAAVGDMDGPDARYVGEPVPEEIATALRTASGAAPDAPLEMFQQGSAWRCMGGKVYGCFVGANIPCWSNANTDPTPTAAETEFCQAQPNAEIIPAVVTGHETVYEWRCNNGTPEIVRQVFQVDARGYIVDFWYELNPE